MIYSPEEDSYLLKEIIKKEIPKLLENNKELKFLEVGCGSGINLSAAEESGIKKENIFSCDINKEAVKYCKSLGYTCVKSDLFKKIKKTYDVIIFNPPYLPEDKYDKESDTTGGKKGDEVIIKFLKDAKRHLKKEGKIFLLISSLTPKIDFKKLKYKTRKIANKRLFYEELFVWELNV